MGIRGAPVSCGFCPSPVPVREGRGRHAIYCSPECAKGAEALAILARVLPLRPGAILTVMEAIEAIPVDNGGLDIEQVRRVRGAAFTIGSRGKRLAPGTSGRYARKAS